jgi:serine/threonine protein kinase
MKTVVGNSEYRLETALGRGGMGEVWKAVDARTGRNVAVKILSAPHLADDQFEAAVRREVQAMATLEHPNVVLVHDYGRIDEGSFIVMELASESLGHILMRRPLRWPELFDVLSSVLQALAHAHSRGLIHRDIKPDNVLAFTADQSTTWKLTDFGISHTIDQENSGIHEFAVGTPEFMPPEQFGGAWREYGPSTDLYAVGCLGWTLATGQPPYPGKALLQLAQQHMYEEPGPLHPASPIPPSFETWLRRLLEKSPRDRYPYAADALHALRECDDESLYGLERTSSEMGQFQRSTGNLGSTSSARIAETMNVAMSSQRQPPLRPSRTMRAKRNDVPPMPLAWERPFKRATLPTSPSLFGLRTIPFIGREREIDRLWGRLHDLFHSGKPRGFVIEGPTGTGKSRLVEALCERASEVGCARIFKVEHTERNQYDLALVQALQAELRCNGLPGDKLRRRLTELFAEREALPEWAVESLALAFTAIGDDGANTGNLGPGAAENIEDAVAEVFQRWSDERPLIVWLDDWQWADGSSELVRAIATHGLPIMWIATVQTDALIERGGTPLALAWMWKDAERIHVGPLSDREIERLLGRLLKLDSSLIRKLAQSVQGNPLFAVQMVGNWVERGLLVDDDGKFGLARGATLEPPDDLHSVWTNRLNRLLEGKNEPDGEALEVAALMGGEVDEVTWLRACFHYGIRPSEELMDDMIDQRLADRNENGWSFVHGMLRASLERRARESGRLEASHSAIADALQELVDDPAPSMLARIGRHLAEGGRHEEALGPLFGGARRLAQRGETSAAEAAITLYLKTAGQANVHPRHMVLGEIEHADILARRDDPRAASRREKASTAAAEFGEWALLARANYVKSQMAYRATRYPDAREAMEAAFDLASSHGIGISAEMNLHHADTLAHMGYIDDAEHFYRLAERDFRSRNDQDGLAGCEFGMGWVALVRREFARAEAMLRASMRRFAAVGNRRKEREVSNSLGDTLRLAGRFEDARRIYLENWREPSGGRRSKSAAKTAANLALLEISRADLGTARRWLERFETVAPDDASMHLFRRISRLYFAAHTSKWAEFDTLWNGLVDQFLAMETYEFDMVDLLEQTGYLAAERGESTRATAVLEVLQPAWERMGQPDRCRNYLVKLKSFAEA